MQAEGYVGAPLLDSNGRCLGLICAIARAPLANPKLAEAVLQIFAERASTELERQQTDERWRGFVIHGNEAIIRLDLEHPISLNAPENEQIDHYYQHAFVADCNNQAAALFGLTDAAGLIGARLEQISPRTDPEQMDRLRAFIREGYRFSQVERKLAGHTIC